MSLCVYCRTSTRDVLLYNFPEHEPTLKLWLQNMGHDLNWKPLKSDFLCSKHFLNNDKCSIPTIFNNDAGKETDKMEMESPTKNTTIQNPAKKLSESDYPVNLSVCRICLAMDVKMYHISEHKLTDMYEQITGVQINTNEKLPQNLCWECAARLSSANNFREKALKTLCILLNRLEDDKLISISDINSIKIDHQIKATLSPKFYKANDYYLNIIKDVVKNENNIANFHEDDTISKDNNGKALDREVDVTVEEVATDSYVFTYTGLDTCEDSEIKKEPVDRRDVGCQSGNGVISNEKIAIGCDYNESNKKENIVDVDSRDTRKVVKRKERRTEGIESSNDKKSKTLPRFKKLVVVLEDIRFNQRFHKQVVEQLRKVDKNYSIINENSTIVDTARTINGKKSLKKLFICDYCCKRVQHKRSLIRHIQIHHTENPIFIYNTQVKPILNCFYCDFSTSKKYYLDEHINSKHTNKNVYSCSYCSFETYHKSTLKNHINAKHTKSNVFECAYCNYQASQKVHLMKHINAKHTKTTSFNCTKCNYTTYFKYALDSHIKIKHTKSNNYLCSHCDYKTFTKETLKLHINSKHTKSRVFNCSLCSYSSFTKSRLSRHINGVHTKAIYFNCSLCKYKAYTKSHLTRHIGQVHNKKKVVYNYCSYCAYKSSSKILLDEHINWKHTKTIAFTCSICSYKAYRKRDLTRHVVQVHDKLIMTAMNNSGSV